MNERKVGVWIRNTARDNNHSDSGKLDTRAPRRVAHEITKHSVTGTLRRRHAILWMLLLILRTSIKRAGECVIRHAPRRMTNTDVNEY